MGWGLDKVVSHTFEEVESISDRVGDERRAAVDALAPAEIKNYSTATAEVQKKYKEISDKSDNHKKAILWARDIFSNGVMDVHTDLFNSDFEDKLKDVYYKNPGDFPFVILTEIIYDLVVNPSLFVFSVLINRQGDTSVIITPYRVWKDKQELAEIKFDDIIPDWLIKVKENIFNVNTDQTIAEVRRSMLTCGFREEPDLLSVTAVIDVI